MAPGRVGRAWDRITNRRGQRPPLIEGSTASSLLTGLLAGWALSDETDVLGSRTLTNNGSTPFVSGKVGNCADLASASSQYFSRAAAALGFTTAVSVSVWLKQDAAANDRTIIQLGNNGGSSNNFLKLESNYIYQRGSTGTDKVHSTGITTSTNWIHWVVTIDGTSAVSYRDNTATAFTLNQAFGGTDDSRLMYIGAYDNGTPTPIFDGLIDEVYLWSRAITAAEVSSLYNSGNGRTHPFTGT